MTTSAAGHTGDSRQSTASEETASGAGLDGRTDNIVRTLRILAGASVSAVLLFLINSYLTFWLQWPGVPEFFADRQWLGVEGLSKPLSDTAAGQGWIQFLLYPAALAVVVGYVFKTPHISLRLEYAKLTNLATFIIRAAFWSVLLIGLVDWAISALRVEGVLQNVVGTWLSDELGRPTFRGIYIHYPLLALSVIIACFTRTLGFPWLALLIVIAEIQIVLSRFIFSYEQAYMGDLVRFWYAALFLFASSYALIHEGHVRVDVFYARFARKRKARTNAVGSLLLGLPLCWVILTMGMWQKGSSLISPLTSYEISQAGFGMYVKYLMAGYLIIFAASMAIQFSGYFLDAVADMRGEPGGAEEDVVDEEHEGSPLEHPERGEV